MNIKAWHIIIYRKQHFELDHCNNRWHKYWLLETISALKRYKQLDLAGLQKKKKIQKKNRDNYHFLVPCWPLFHRH